MKLSFKEYLTEIIPDSKFTGQLLLCGGNVLIDGEHADSIDLNFHERAKVTQIIKDALIELDAKFVIETGLDLWKADLIHDNKIFSGSTKHLFDDAVEEKKLKKHKATFGDVDLMIDLDLKTQFLNFISDEKYNKFGGLKLIGSKLSGDQIITLWHLKEYDFNVQIDFEGVPFENGEPTEWAHFSHSSSFEDIAHGVKGAFHKLLLTSLMAPKKVEAIEQMKTKQKEIIAGTHSLSVKGLRQKYEEIGKDEETGKPIYKNTNSKDFITDFDAIYEHVFSKKPTAAAIKKFWSFKGMLELIKDNMSPKEREDVIESFIEKLFGEGAQSLYRDDNRRDMGEKMTAVRFMEDRLNVEFNEEKLADMQTSFYLKKK